MLTLALLSLTTHAEAFCIRAACPIDDRVAGLVLPLDGATDQATSVAPVVHDIAQAALYISAEDLWVGATMERVPTTAAMSLAVPQAPLPAEALVEVWSVHPTTGDPSELLGSFQTAAGPDAEVPARPVGIVATSEVEGGGTCGGDDRAVLRARWEAGDVNDTVLYETRFSHTSFEELTTTLITDSMAGVDSICGAQLPGIADGEIVSVEVRATDLSGNVSEWTDPLQVEFVAAPIRRGCTTGPVPLGLGWVLLLATTALMRRDERQPGSRS